MRQFFLHVITGFLAVLLHYAVMSQLLEENYSPVIASSGGFVFGALTRFFMAYFHVFSPKSSIAHTLSKFILCLVIQAFLNFLLLKAFIGLSMPIWWSQIFTTGSLTVINYVVYRVWVFI
jgi:putative flippase GtrA